MLSCYLLVSGSFHAYTQISLCNNPVRYDNVCENILQTEENIQMYYSGRLFIDPAPTAWS